MSLDPSPRQRMILEEKVREVLTDPGYDEADKVAMRDFYRTLVNQ